MNEWLRPSLVCSWNALLLLLISDTLKVSSVHLTFNTAEEWQLLSGLGFLQRTGIQYHWWDRVLAGVGACLGVWDGEGVLMHCMCARCLPSFCVLLLHVVAAYGSL